MNCGYPGGLYVPEANSFITIVLDINLYQCESEYCQVMFALY